MLLAVAVLAQKCEDFTHSVEVFVFEVGRDQFGLHELGAPVEEVLELLGGAHLGGNEIMGGLVLQVAITIPFQNFENTPHLQEPKMLLRIVLVIGLLHQVLEEGIICYLHPVL